MKEVTVQQNRMRARYQAVLFLWDHRYRADHPYAGLFTGLHTKFKSRHDYGTWNNLSNKR